MYVNDVFENQEIIAMRKVWFYQEITYKIFFFLQQKSLVEWKIWDLHFN